METRDLTHVHYTCANMQTILHTEINEMGYSILLSDFSIFQMVSRESEYTEFITLETGTAIS